MKLNLIVCIIHLNYQKALHEEYPNALTPVLNAIQLIEKCSEVIYLVVTFVTPISFILPKFFYCMYCYYVTGAGSDSFELMNHVEWLVNIQYACVERQISSKSNS